MIYFLEQKCFGELVGVCKFELKTFGEGGAAAWNLRIVQDPKDGVNTEVCNLI